MKPIFLPKSNWILFTWPKNFAKRSGLKPYLPTAGIDYFVEPDSYIGGLLFPT